MSLQLRQQVLGNHSHTGYGTALYQVRVTPLKLLASGKQFVDVLAKNNLKAVSMTAANAVNDLFKVCHGYRSSDGRYSWLIKTLTGSFDRDVFFRRTKHVQTTIASFGSRYRKSSKN